MNRQRLLLAILVGVLVLSLAYAFWAMPREEKAPPRAAVPASKPAAKSVPPKNLVAAKERPSDERLNLELLNGNEQPFPGSGRDIFRFRGGWVPVEPVAAAPPQEEEPPPPPPPLPPTPKELLQGEMSAYRVAGFLEKRGTRSVFLLSSDEVSIIKVGESFGKRNQYVASAITATELVVAMASDRSVAVRVPIDEGGNHDPAVISPVSVSRPEAEAESSESPRQRVRRVRNRPVSEEEAAEPVEAPERGQEASGPDSLEQEMPSGEEE